MDELKACPFCGPGQSIVSCYQDDYDYWVVGCGRCGSHSGIRPPSDPDGREKVIASWNSRAHEEYTDKARLLIEEAIVNAVAERVNFEIIKKLAVAQSNLNQI